MDKGTIDFDTFKDSIKVKKKKVQRGELVPIEDILNEANQVTGRCYPLKFVPNFGCMQMLSQDTVGDLPVSLQDRLRGRASNELDELMNSADESLSDSERAVKQAIVKARGKNVKKKRSSQVEMRLIQSPFADPVELAKTTL